MAYLSKDVDHMSLLLYKTSKHARATHVSFCQTVYNSHEARNYKLTKKDARVARRIS
jgi:hypothetical protein